MIIIIGGGISGLAAAYELTRRRMPFVVLESSARAGGLIRTEHSGGFTIEAGPDSILAQKPAAVQLCEELGLASRLIGTTPPRSAFVLKRGRLHRLPSPSVLGIPTTLAALARYDLLPWTARARIATEPLIPARSFADESVASFFRRRFGAATVDLVAEPLLGGIHAGDVERLSMPALFPRLVDAERKPGRVLLNLRGGSAARDPEGLFRSLRGGMSELVAALTGVLPGGSLRLSSPATGLQRSAASWKVIDSSTATEARAVIFAAPAPVVAALLDPLDTAAAVLCREVPYVSTASIALAWRRADVRHPLAGSGFVVARRHNPLRITACTWVSSKWESRAPADHVLLRAFVGGSHDPGVVDLGDDELIATAVRDVSGVLGIATPPLLTRVFRWRNAGAQHNVGHDARLGGLKARLRSLPGLFVTGSGFDSIGIPDCVAHGRQAAAAAADYVTMG